MMPSFGQPERATQNHAIPLFRGEPGDRTLRGSLPRLVQPQPHAEQIIDP